MLYSVSWFINSDRDLFRWGIHGKPDDDEDPPSVDDDVSNCDGSATDDQQESAVDNQQELQAEDEHDSTTDDHQEPTADVVADTDKIASEETSASEEMYWKNFTGNLTKISKNVRPYEAPALPFQGEYYGEEDVMKSMGLPVSFARSPWDFEEVCVTVAM